MKSLKKGTESLFFNLSVNDFCNTFHKTPKWYCITVMDYHVKVWCKFKYNFKVYFLVSWKSECNFLLYHWKDLKSLLGQYIVWGQVVDFPYTGECLALKNNFISVRFSNQN